MFNSKGASGVVLYRKERVLWIFRRCLCKSHCQVNCRTV